MYSYGPYLRNYHKQKNCPFGGCMKCSCVKCNEPLLRRGRIPLCKKHINEYRNELRKVKCDIKIEKVNTKIEQLKISNQYNIKKSVKRETRCCLKHASPIDLPSKIEITDKQCPVCIKFK